MNSNMFFKLVLNKFLHLILIWFLETLYINPQTVMLRDGLEGTFQVLYLNYLLFQQEDRDLETLSDVLKTKVNGRDINLEMQQIWGGSLSSFSFFFFFSQILLEVIYIKYIQLFYLIV